MNAEFYRDQVNLLISMVQQGRGDESDSMQVLNAEDYLDVQRFDKEQAMFRRLPLLIGHSREIVDSGDYIVRELNGRSWLIVRGDDGRVRAFYNYCQHRGTKLVQDQAGCKKRFSCPYHAWTYGVQGDLVSIPRPDLFPGLVKANKGLKQAHLEEAYGLLWLTQESSAVQSVTSYLQGLVPEFKALELAKYHIYFDQTRELNANWKLPIFAFLESYHIGTLHKDSIAEFFVENVAYSERHGLHIRSFVPRKKVVELDGVDLRDKTMAEYITPTNIVFPNVCMIAHPTSYTIISLFPGDEPGKCMWRHMLLVPDLPVDDAERAHFDKTVAVLDGITYEKEDMWVSTQVQEGINAGAVDELILGKNETMLKVFSDIVAQNI